MKVLTAIIIYIFFLLILLIGILTIVLEEPWYGMGLVMISLLSLPVTSRLISKLSPNILSRRNKIFLSVAITLAILIGIFSLGRKDYGKVENITPQELATLSIHPIQQVKINNLDYYYIEKGEGETILLLHGFPDMANTWDETITELSKTHRVVAPFLRGYYPTSIPQDDDYAVKTIAQDMIGLMDELSIQNFSVVGQDWGGAIGYMITNLVDERVNKFVSIAIPHPSCLELSPAMLYAGRHFFVLSLGNYGARYARKNDFEYIDRLYQRWSPDYKEWQKSSNAIKETFKFPNRTEAATGYYRSFAKERGNKDIQALNDKIPTTPILFLLGKNDLVYSEELVTSMRSKMPLGSETIVFENAGHFLHREIFEDYIIEVKSFLEID